MTNRKIESSELLINPDGTIFHLHLHPEQLADKIIMVGDPGRVPMVAKHFDTKDFDVQSREFRTIGGTKNGEKVMCVSHGIGPDNMDIVVNELDALANIDFATGTVKERHRILTMVRIGTSGALQPEIPLGAYVIAGRSIGFDGVLNYYAGCREVTDIEFEEKLKADTDWDPRWAAPYVVPSDPGLIERIGKGEMIEGITISAVGFYGPQGRELRLPLSRPKLNESIEKFEFHGAKITNYEMESAPLEGLSLLLGHNAMTVCLIIANRYNLDATPDYKAAMERLVSTVVERI